MARVHAESLFAVAPGFFDGARIYTGSRDNALDGEQGGVDAALELEERVQLGEEEAAGEGVDDAKLSKWTCGACGLKFQNGDDQRLHFKSDFHRLNVKRRVAGKHCFNEEEFEKFAGGDIANDTDVSSVSGSESDADDDDDERRSRSIVSGKASIPLLLASGSLVEAWSCIVLRGSERLIDGHDKQEPGTVSEAAFLSRLKSLASSPKVIWIVLLAVGGHFAGVVVDMKTGTVQAHQTYHRYVVRAKAGGKQANRDATGRAPKSAGASLRRYNEMALQKEVKSLLESWTAYLQDASCIFVFAPSRNSQSIFGDKPLLSRDDDRVRSIPFPTRRPTYKEARRVYGRLSSLQHKERDEAEAAKPLEEAAPVSVTKSEKKVTAPTDRSSTNTSVDEEPTPPLHAAVIADDAALAMELLESGADPCAKHRGKTAYAAATSKETRNAFRKFMASHIDKWDWNAANVPSPLTDEMEAAQAAKQAEKTAKRKAKEKERKLERKAQQKAAAAAAAAAEIAKSAKSCSKETTQEAGIAKQRELRAAAAESRMKASMLSSGSSETCSCCASSLANKVPFYKFEFRYCSVACVNEHRQMLLSP